MGLVNDGVPPRNAGAVGVLPAIVLGHHFRDVLAAIGVRTGILDPRRWAQSGEPPTVGVQHDLFLGRVRRALGRGRKGNETVPGTLRHRRAHVRLEHLRARFLAVAVQRRGHRPVMDAVVVALELVSAPRAAGALIHQLKLLDAGSVDGHIGAAVPGRRGVNPQRITTRLHDGARLRTA